MHTRPNRTNLELEEAADRGMRLAVQARMHPDRLAVIEETRAPVTFDALNRRTNQLARALRARGLAPGDGVGLLCANRSEFVEVAHATSRCGLRLTPINGHLKADEVRYILEDCGAKAFFADVRFAEAANAAVECVSARTLGIAIGGDLPLFADYEEVLAGESEDDLDEPVAGSTMFYTSGTTGRPKGVIRPPGARLQAPILVAEHGCYDGATDRHLCTGPMVHAAPLAFSVFGPLAAGVGIVVMDGFDAARALRLIETHRVTHSAMVPTMFHRLLALDEELRTSADCSSLRFIVHGAAPCPPSSKRRMMDWLGPILYEYYSATEGFGCFVTPEEWLRKPGTVGRPEPGHIEARHEDGSPVATGEVGELFLRAPGRGRFAYFGDPAKTRTTYDASGDFFSLGDLGRFDEDGYLYLCDRSADLIISGGVNVYPAEVDAVLTEHPCVADAATVGIPHESFGESVHAVVELRPGVEPTTLLAGELIAHAREHLAAYKCPRSVEFSESLPRSDAGKMLRRELRERARRAHGGPA